MASVMNGGASRAAIREAVEGKLAAGGRFPGARAVAAELGLAPGTVDYHIRRLIADGELSRGDADADADEPRGGRISDEERDMAECNRGLVRTVAATIRGVDAADEDVFQAGCLGLIEAARRYDPERGTKFSTCATYWIERAVRDHAWGDRLVRAPRYLAGKAAANHPFKAFADAARGVATASADWSEGVAPEPTVAPPESEAERAEAVERVRAAVASLPDDERAVVLARMEGRSYTQAGAALGRSHDFARSRERLAHERLREMLAGLA